MIKFDHIVLRVSNFDIAASFYRSLFTFAGFEEVADAKDGRTIGFRAPDGFTLWIEETKELKTGDSLGWLDHYALHCQSRETVNQAYNFCKSQRWEIISEPKANPSYGNFYGFVFCGPDGIKLEFVTRESELR